MSNAPLWLQVTAVAVPALVSIASAIWASRSANRARRAERDAVRLLALEERTASKKYELYEPFVAHLGDLLTPARKKAAETRSEEVMANFQTSVMMWGSDEAVSAFSRFRRASAANPPAHITMRLVADLLIAIRRDIAVPDSRTTGIEILGSRINDLTKESAIARALQAPFNEVCQEHGWEPPFEFEIEPARKRKG